jgi:hypothetical protein
MTRSPSFPQTSLWLQEMTLSRLERCSQKVGRLDVPRQILILQVDCEYVSRNSSADLIERHT